MHEEDTENSPNVPQIPISEDTRGGTASHRDLLRAFTAISKALNLAQPLSKTLDLIAEKVSQTMGHKYCAVLLADEETKGLRIQGSFGIGEEYVRRLNTELLQKTEGDGPSARSVTAQAYRTRMPVYAPDITADPRFAPWREAALEAGYRSIVALPLVFREQVIGVLNCYDEPREYTEDQVEALMVVAEQAASAAGIARLMDAQRATIEELNSFNEHFASQHRLLQRSEGAHEALTALLLEDCSLADITTTLAGLLEAPVILQDEGFSVISSSGSEDVRYGGLSAQRGALSLRYPALSALRRTGRAQTLEPGSTEPQPGEAPTLLVTLVDLGNHELGYLSTPSLKEDGREFSMRILEQAATVYGLYMARQQAAREAEDRLRGDLLSELLSGRFKDDTVLHERVRYLGLDYSRGRFRVLVVRHEPLPDYLRRKGEDQSMLGRSGGRLLALAREFASDLATHQGTGSAIADADGNHLVVVASFPRAHDLCATAERLVHTIRRRFPDLGLRVAASAPCEKPEELAARYEEAQSLLDLADRLELPDEAMCYEDWKLYGLLLRGGDRRDFSEVAHRYLDPLIEYGRHGNSDLLPTLEAYLDNNLSPSRTAQALFVHLNTVKYRLGRISDLVGADLGDVQTILALKVALMQRHLGPEHFDAEAWRRR